MNWIINPERHTDACTQPDVLGGNHSQIEQILIIQQGAISSSTYLPSSADESVSSS